MSASFCCCFYVNKTVKTISNHETNEKFGYRGANKTNPYILHKLIFEILNSDINMTRSLKRNELILSSFFVVVVIVEYK